MWSHGYHISGYQYLRSRCVDQSRIRFAKIQKSPLALALVGVTVAESFAADRCLALIYAIEKEASQRFVPGEIKPLQARGQVSPAGCASAVTTPVRPTSKMKPQTEGESNLDTELLHSTLILAGDNHSHEHSSVHHSGRYGGGRLQLAARESGVPARSARSCPRNGHGPNLLQTVAGRRSWRAHAPWS